MQYGDTLFTIASRFHTTPEQIARMNNLSHYHLAWGQQLYIPYLKSQDSRSAGNHSQTRQQAYRPVTAYTATRPILVNGVDINTGLYPVLNYQPENAEYPYIYVPIAEFRRVGARVTWKEQEQLIVVETDYYQLKQENERLRAQLAAYGPIPQQGNTSGNISNWGIAAQQGDWVYFSNITNGNRLYKMRLDGTAKQKLNDDNALYINVMGDWVYYINRNDQMKMYKIRTDGTQRTKIDDQHSATVMVVVGDWIYYVTQSEQYRIYKMNVNGTGKTRMGEDYGVEEMYVSADWIFYTAQPQNLRIYKIKTDGTNRAQVTQDSARQLNVVGDWIYFVNQTLPGIFRVKWDGTGKTSFAAEYSNPTSLNVHGDWIYYGYSDLYKTRLDSPEQIKLTPVYGFAGLINVVGEWLFFRVQYNGEKLLRMKTDGTQAEIVG
ncbi:DUF5050 domain-containing protein [Ammoniphilus sp. YIM 78166]|uniref:DUF5050 domain-containing protein n=1 Tax=Ammoniphilus sp. YIM 78166 TaxID=1644106 RepID=UPI0014308B1A|nr:DUF5050 domain-containing protein [Ammoniphilus sp. YIM 78166]